MRTNLRDQFSPETIRATGAKIVARNTFARHENGARVIRLHATDIVHIHDDGKVVLNTGGWRTVTTKARLNAYLPRGYDIYTRRGIWYVHGPGRAQEIPFYDGMILPDCFADSTRASAERSEQEQRKLAKQIAQFVAKLSDGPIPAPDAGDCWCCATERPTSSHYFGCRASGGMATSADHLLAHVREGYLHGTLIHNALMWAGYRAAYAHMIPRTAIKSALRRYLRRNLGLAT